MRRRLTFAFSSSQFLFLFFLSFFLLLDILRLLLDFISVENDWRESPEDQELFLKGSTALVVSTKKTSSKEFSGQLWTFLRIPLSCLTESCTFGYGSKDLTFLYSTC